MAQATEASEGLSVTVQHVWAIERCLRCFLVLTGRTQPHYGEGHGLPVEPSGNVGVSVNEQTLCIFRYECHWLAFGQ